MWKCTEKGNCRLCFCGLNDDDDDDETFESSLLLITCAVYSCISPFSNIRCTQKKSTLFPFPFCLLLLQGFVCLLVSVSVAVRREQMPRFSSSFSLSLPLPSLSLSLSLHTAPYRTILFTRPRRPSSYEARYCSYRSTTHVELCAVPFRAAIIISSDS